MKITKEQAEALILAVVGEVDYDIQKSLQSDTAEDPEMAADEMDRLATWLVAYFDHNL